MSTASVTKNHLRETIRQLYRYFYHYCSAFAWLRFNSYTAIEIGKKLLVRQMPAKVVVFAVNIQEVPKVTEEMTEKVSEAIPRAVNLVLEEMVQ